jgi:hypothetical protein
MTITERTELDDIFVADGRIILMVFKGWWSLLAEEVTVYESYGNVTERTELDKMFFS